MEIRRLAPGDEGLMVALAARVKGRVPTAAEAGAYLSDPDNWCFVALAEGEPAGVAIAYRLARWDGATMVCLYELEVLPEYRRHGYGRALAVAVFRAAAASGAAKAWVLADEDNVPAARTYTGAGASRTGRETLFTRRFS